MKLFNLFFQLFLFEIFILVHHFSNALNHHYQNTTTTTLHPPLERMLSRKKRFLLMPKGCHLKFTGQLSKRLIAAFPRGFNFNIEMALYYPAPTTRQDVIPKRLRKPTTTTPKPIGTKPPIFVCIPGSLFCWKAKPAIKPMKVQRIDDENVDNIKWIEPTQQQQQQQIMDYKNYENYENYVAQQQHYTNPQQWTKYAKYGDPQQYEKYKWTPSNKQINNQHQYQYYQQQQHQKYKTNTHRNWTNWSSKPQYHQYNQTAYNQWSKPRFQQYQTQTRQQRWRRTLRRADAYLPVEYGSKKNDDVTNDDDDDHDYDPLKNPKLIQFPDLEPHLDWTHYHSHRDRRQLFHQFEGLTKVFGFDMKSCLMRAICESKRYLLPPGYSLIQDILRIVFTLPTTSGLEDDYSRAMRADYETCNKFLKPKCAYNILNWFLNPVKGL